MMAWMKAEMKKAQPKSTVPGQTPVVCLLTPCLVSTLGNQLVSTAEGAAAAGLKLHVICCSAATSPELQIESLQVSHLLSAHGAEVTFTAPEYPTMLRDVQRALTAAVCQRTEAELHVSSSSTLPPLRCCVTPLCAPMGTAASPVVLCGCHGRPVMTARDMVASGGLLLHPVLEVFASHACSLSRFCAPGREWCRLHPLM